MPGDSRPPPPADHPPAEQTPQLLCERLHSSASLNGGAADETTIEPVINTADNPPSNDPANLRDSTDDGHPMDLVASAVDDYPPCDAPSADPHPPSNDPVPTSADPVSCPVADVLYIAGADPPAADPASTCSDSAPPLSPPGVPFTQEEVEAHDPSHQECHELAPAACMQPQDSDTHASQTSAEDPTVDEGQPTVHNPPAKPLCFTRNPKHQKSTCTTLNPILTLTLHCRC